MVINIDLQSILGTPKTFLSGSIASGVTNLSVLNSYGMTANDYLLVGELGSEKTEVVQISNVPTPTTLTVTATKFPHPNNTLIQKIYFNQVKIEKSTDGGGVWNVVETLGINGDQSSVDYVASGAISNDYYRSRFYNSSALVYSEYTNTITAQGSIVDLAYDGVLMKLRESRDGLISFESFFDILADIDMTIANGIYFVNKAYFKFTYNIDLVNGTYDYVLPSYVTVVTKVEVKYTNSGDYIPSKKISPDYGAQNDEYFKEFPYHYIYQSSNDGLWHIVLKAVPDTNVSAGLKVSGVKQPTRATSATDSLNTPNPMSRLTTLKYGVLEEIYRNQKDNDRKADNYRDKFLSECEDILRMCSVMDESEEAYETSQEVQDIFNA